MNCEMKACRHNDTNGGCKLSGCAYIQRGIFNFSKYSRENIPKPLPSFKVGDTVRITTEKEITLVGKDCDGTPLYGLDGLGFGWSEVGNKMKLVKEAQC